MLNVRLPRSQITHTSLWRTLSHVTSSNQNYLSRHSRRPAIVLGSLQRHDRPSCDRSPSHGACPLAVPTEAPVSNRRRRQRRPLPSRLPNRQPSQQWRRPLSPRPPLSQPFKLYQCQAKYGHTATGDEYMATIPGFSSRMVREFLEYRPYVGVRRFPHDRQVCR